MTEQQAKIYLSKYVLPKTPEGAILRQIIFRTADIDWKEVINDLYAFNPELKNEKYFDSLDLTVK